MSLGLKGLDNKAYDPLHTQYYVENDMNRARKFVHSVVKMSRLSKMANTIFEKFTRCAKDYGLFS